MLINMLAFKENFVRHIIIIIVSVVYSPNYKGQTWERTIFRPTQSAGWRWMRTRTCTSLSPSQGSPSWSPSWLEWWWWGGETPDIPTIRYIIFYLSFTISLLLLLHIFLLSILYNTNTVHCSEIFINFIFSPWMSSKIKTLRVTLQQMTQFLDNQLNTNKHWLIDKLRWELWSGWCWLLVWSLNISSLSQSKLLS